MPFSSIWKEIKFQAWSFGLLKHEVCPFCNSQMVLRGHMNEAGCPNLKCEFPFFEEKKRALDLRGL